MRILIIFFTLFTATISTYAMEQQAPVIISKINKKDLMQKLANIGTQLAAGASSINISAAKLGINTGLVANVIVGIGRKVERNPFSTSDQDAFLVKDRLKLGIELGASFVAKGSIQYIQEWSLIYPSKTYLNAALSHNFIFDLFLKEKAHDYQQKGLPDNYTLKRDSYFLGIGEIRIPGVDALQIGIGSSVAKVSLESFLAKMDNNKLKIMIQRSHYYKIAIKLWNESLILDIPLFEHNQSIGQLSRKYVLADLNMMSFDIKNQFLNFIFTGINKEVLHYTETYDVVESKFHETQNEIGLLSFFNFQSIEREDYISSRNTNWWQWEHRYEQQWDIGISSERLRAKIFISGGPEIDTNKRIREVKDARLHLNFNVADWQLQDEELHKSYIPMLNLINDNYSNYCKADNLSMTKNINLTSFEPNNEARLNVAINLDKTGIFNIIHTKESQWYQRLSELTNKSVAFWKQENSFRSSSRTRLYQSRASMAQIHFSRTFKAFLRLIKKANTIYSQDQLNAYRLLAHGLKNSIQLTDGRWNTLISRLISQFSGCTHHDITLNLIQFSEHTKVAHLFQAQTNKLAQNTKINYRFIIEDPSEYYYFFDNLTQAP